MLYMCCIMCIMDKNVFKISNIYDDSTEYILIIAYWIKIY